MRPRLSAPLLVGVGAAFDFHAGLVSQAPPWMQRNGLEWTYRLSREPRRLWRRYARYNPRFVAGFARQYLRDRRSTPRPDQPVERRSASRLPLTSGFDDAPRRAPPTSPSSASAASGCRWRCRSPTAA